VIGVLSQFLQGPRQPHWEALSYFAVLKGCTCARGKDLLYKPSQKLTMEGFSDADWAGNRSDRRSTSAYCIFVGGNLVTCSKKQAIVARSSAEAEYRAMAHTAFEMM